MQTLGQQQLHARGRLRPFLLLRIPEPLASPLGQAGGCQQHRARSYRVPAQGWAGC